MSKAYTPEDDLAKLHEYQKQYIDEHFEELRDLPHPDEFWTLFDAELEQKNLQQHHEKGVINMAGTEETDIGEIAYWNLTWPAYTYITQKQ